VNRLQAEASTYLRQHAENPVDWYPWSDEALARARAEDRPIFLSIGYSSCHWCHVMARESFSDPDLAEFLNANFVCIKVDREERPDLDEIYVEAVRVMAGSAGWPLTVFLTPELKPFYGGTYFPPEPRHNLPAFRRVLESVLHFYREERHEIDEAANRVTAELNRLSETAGSDAQLGPEPMALYYRQKLETFDSDHGGFGVAPKFPSPTDLLLLLRLSSRPGFEYARQMVELTLRKMADGGVNDQLGGGFHRYSTDTVWLVPHFEKMLYDNALLARLYAEAAVRLDNDFYRAVADSTLDWLERELWLPDGGFGSAVSAEDAGGEGTYYTWTRDEVSSAVGEELAPLAWDLFGVHPAGNYEGRNVLHVVESPEVLARRHGVDLAAFWDRSARIQSGLSAARANRPAPARDDKALADWNGLALSAFAVAARLLGDERRLSSARRIAGFLTDRLVDGDCVVHFRRPGATDVPGQLPDYANVVQGLLDLYAADHDPAWLERALRLADRMVEAFADPAGGFYTTRAGQADVLARVKNAYDGAIPSGNSVAVRSLVRLARLTGRNEYERVAAAALRRFWPLLRQFPTAFSVMLDALDLLLNPGPEIVLFAPGSGGEARLMRDLLSRRPDADTVVVVPAGQPGGPLERLIPLTSGRTAVDRKPTAYVCRGHTCSQPVHTAAELRRLLAG
jgi:uncharacterized protein YyaL (SSP411 family)